MKERKYGFKDACFPFGGIGMKPFNCHQAIADNGPKEDTMQGTGADFEGSLLQKGNRVVLHNRLALKKRVYEASDWDSSVKRWKLIKHTVIIW